MKSMFASKTMWFNMLSLAAGILLVMQESVLLQGYEGAIISVLAVVNLGLRLVTSQSIK